MFLQCQLENVFLRVSGRLGLPGGRDGNPGRVHVDTTASRRARAWWFGGWPLVVSSASLVDTPDRRPERVGADRNTCRDHTARRLRGAIPYRASLRHACGAPSTAATARSRWIRVVETVVGGEAEQNEREGPHKT